MGYSTSIIGINPATGSVQVYVPPKVNGIPQGAYNVSYGTILDVPDGTTVPTGGTWLIISGTVVTQGAAQVQEVVVTPA